MILLIAAACATDLTSPTERSACTQLSWTEADRRLFAATEITRELSDAMRADTATFSALRRTLEETDFSSFFSSLVQSDSSAALRLRELESIQLGIGGADGAIHDGAPTAELTHCNSPFFIASPNRREAFGSESAGPG